MYRSTQKLAKHEFEILMCFAKLVLCQLCFQIEKNISFK